MISTPLQAENINKALTAINNEESYDTLERTFKTNCKVYESI